MNISCHSERSAAERRISPALKERFFAALRMTKNSLLIVLWDEMLPNVRQFPGEFFAKRGMAARNEVHVGPFGGGRRDERRFFRRAFCHRDRVPGTLEKRRLTAGEATQSRSSGLAAVGPDREMA
jgi:hypothetical protein